MTSYKLKQERVRARLILNQLHKMYPDVNCTLDFREDPFRLLVGAILAAQCTDARVNKVTPHLFERYPTVAELAAAKLEDIETIVRSCGLFRMKAKNIQATAKQLLQEHDGQVPDSEKALLELPGIGRKIANLILGDSFGKQAVVVDTHCARISRLLGFTKSKNPVLIEKDLMQVLPETEWTNWGHLIVTHGREICIARQAKCGICPLRPHCPSGNLQKYDD